MRYIVYLEKENVEIVADLVREVEDSIEFKLGAETIAVFKHFLGWAKFSNQEK